MFRRVLKSKTGRGGSDDFEELQDFRNPSFGAKGRSLHGAIQHGARAIRASFHGSNRKRERDGVFRTPSSSSVILRRSRILDVLVGRETSGRSGTRDSAVQDNRIIQKGRPHTVTGTPRRGEGSEDERARELGAI